jgi:hypothetical protein
VRLQIAALRDFGLAYDGLGSNSVVPVMSAARPLFHRKRLVPQDALPEPQLEKIVGHVCTVFNLARRSASNPWELYFVPDRSRTQAQKGSR